MYDRKLISLVVRASAIVNITSYKYLKSDKSINGFRDFYKLAKTRIKLDSKSNRLISFAVGTDFREAPPRRKSGGCFCRLVLNISSSLQNHSHHHCPFFST